MNIDKKIQTLSNKIVTRSKGTRKKLAQASFQLQYTNFKGQTNTHDVGPSSYTQTSPTAGSIALASNGKVITIITSRVQNNQQFQAAIQPIQTQSMRNQQRYQQSQALKAQAKAAKMARINQAQNSPVDQSATRYLYDGHNGQVNIDLISNTINRGSNFVSGQAHPTGDYITLNLAKIISQNGQVSPTAPSQSSSTKGYCNKSPNGKHEWQSGGGVKAWCKHCDADGEKNSITMDYEFKSALSRKIRTLRGTIAKLLRFIK